MTRSKILSLALGVEGGLLLVAAISSQIWDIPLWNRSSFTLHAMYWGLIGCVPFLAALYVILHTSSPPLVRLRERLDLLTRELFVYCRPLDLLVIALLAGIGEEALFRGILQTALSEHWGVFPALLATSVMFGLAHYVSLAYALYAVLAGFLLGALFILTGSLAAPIVTHSVYDFVALYILSSRVQPLEGGAA